MNNNKKKTTNLVKHVGLITNIQEMQRIEEHRDKINKIQTRGNSTEEIAHFFIK